MTKKSSTIVETTIPDIPILEPGSAKGLYFVKVNDRCLIDITAEQMYALMALFRHELDNLSFEEYSKELRKKRHKEEIEDEEDE